MAGDPDWELTRWWREGPGCFEPEPDEFALTPRNERQDQADGFAIEAEFADWRPSTPSSKGGKVYDLASGEGTEGRKLYQLEEEENAHLSAVQLLKDVGPGRVEAEVVWKTCVLREKLRLARSVVRTPPRNPLSRQNSDDTNSLAEEAEDTEVCPDNWPEKSFRPLASDFAFNFAELDLAEQEMKADVRNLLLGVFSSWREMIHPDVRKGNGLS